ncbi:MAG: helix-turn-helix domain-containing protein [Clostridiales bacterium]|nr:helix-turn-helix domain-containing protein [Clostridiales bacterium]MDY4199291.1 S24 family peptidase [Candidatus Fimadaptatus sp.]
MELADVLSTRRKELGMTIDELVSRSGIPKGTLNKILNGVTRDPQLETVKTISHALGLTLDDIDDRHKEEVFTADDRAMLSEYRQCSDSSKRLIRALIHIAAQTDTEETHVQEDMTEMIIFDYPAAAGNPLYAEDSYSRISFPSSEIPPRTDFGVRISGASMEPTIPDGSIVWLRKQDAIDPGEIGIFMLDDSAVCKRLALHGNELYLHSDNVKYRDIHISGDTDARCVGLVLGWS